MIAHNRLTKLRQKLAESRVDAILVSQPENRYYLSGFDGSAGFLLITAKKAVLATDFRYIEQAGKQSPDYEVFRTANKIDDWFPELVAGLNVSRLGFEAGDVTFTLHHQLRDALNKRQIPLKLAPINGLIESLRAVKEPGEIELIRKAVAISDAAYEYIEGFIQDDMTEKQVA